MTIRERAKKAMSHEGECNHECNLLLERVVKVLIEVRDEAIEEVLELSYQHTYGSEVIATDAVRTLKTKKAGEL